MTRTSRRLGALPVLLTLLAGLVAVRPADAGAGGSPGIRQYVTTIAPGLTLRRIVDLGTPLRTWILTVDRSQAVTTDVTLARGDRLGGRERTSVMAQNAGAIAAVNGDFTSSAGVPWHPFAMDGSLVKSSVVPGFEFATAVDRSGASIGRPEQSVTALLSSGESFVLDRWNEGPPQPGEIVGFSPAGGDVEMPPADACSARLQPVSPPAALDPGPGVQRSYAVEAIACAADPMAVAGGVVLSALPGSDEAIRLQSLTIGSSVTITWSFGWPDVFDSIGGTPVLVSHGRIAIGGCFGYLCNRHPRTGVGITADGQVLLVVVDGRQPGWSVGLTMSEFAHLFLDLGATFALNLDGGGSSVMVVRGEVQNRPSEGSERWLTSAVLVLPGPDPGEVFSLAPGVGAIVPETAAPPRVSARAELLDPGSTGGLLDALARGSFGFQGRLPRELRPFLRAFRAGS